MKKIDLHQDLVCSYPWTLNSHFFGGMGGWEIDSDYNVWDRGAYRHSEIEGVFTVVRPYHVEWDMKDTRNRKITFDASSIPTQIDEYNTSRFVDYQTYSQWNKDTNQIRNILHLEWHDELHSIDELTALYESGVRSFGFVWNNYNTLSWANPTPTIGLSPLGRDVVKYCNEIGVIIDLAHMSFEWMREVLELTSMPVMNTHSNVYELFHHYRNIPDFLIRGIARTGGVIGLSIYSDFIGIRDATISQYCDQITHVMRVGWQDSVWFGSDYHGIPKDKIVQWLHHISWVSLLEDEVIRRYGYAFAEKFFYTNAKRVIDEILS